MAVSWLLARLGWWVGRENSRKKLPSVFSVKPSQKLSGVAGGPWRRGDTKPSEGKPNGAEFANGHLFIWHALVVQRAGDASDPYFTISLPSIRH